MSSCCIRRATTADLPAITAIYNDAIINSTATFDTDPKSLDDRAAWLASHGERYPVLVAELDGEVVGWSSLSRWSDRRAYDGTAETTFYVSAQHRGRGIGRVLKAAIIDEARRLGFHSLIARVAEGSDASLHLNECFGFRRVGTLKEVGQKFDRLLDVHILQKMLREEAS
jgi:phosphinothricin acetyltransferase